MPYSSAAFSAVSGIESTPYISRMRGLIERQPSVESAISRSRAKGAAALLRTNGARDMLSTPPATTSAASPQRMARAACTPASMPDPPSRLTVTPGTSTGSPPPRPPGRRAAPPSGHVAVVFARLIGTAENHVVHGPAVERRVSREEGLDRRGSEFVRPHAGKGASIAAERRADCAAQVGFAHR